MAAQGAFCMLTSNLTRRETRTTFLLVVTPFGTGVITGSEASPADFAAFLVGCRKSMGVFLGIALPANTGTWMATRKYRFTRRWTSVGLQSHVQGAGHLHRVVAFGDIFLNQDTAMDSTRISCFIAEHVILKVAAGKRDAIQFDQAPTAILSARLFLTWMSARLMETPAWLRTRKNIMHTF